MDTHLRCLLEDICEHAMRMKDQWNCWDIEQRHEATNELNARAAAADHALMDAVRLTDFTDVTEPDATHADEPTEPEAGPTSQHPADEPVRAS